LWYATLSPARTITPISIPHFLKVGINTNSPEYLQLLQSIDEIDENTLSFNSSADDVEYKSLDNDVKDPRILKWTDPDSSYALSIHLFSNSIGIVEATIPLPNNLNVEQLEAESQNITKELINQSYSRLLELLNKFDKKIKHSYWDYQQKMSPVKRLFIGYHAHFYSRKQS
jgi:hypothetical protein